MTIDDRILGLALLAFGALVAWIAQGFPLMAGLPYGPGFFPTIAATGLMICGAVIAATGQVAAIRRGRVPAAPPPAETLAAREAAPVAVAGRVFAIIAIVALSALLLNLLGFHVTAALAVATSAMVFGCRPLIAVPLGIVSAIAVHAIFYSALRVPLPWGLLYPWAW